MAKATNTLVEAVVCFLIFLLESCMTYIHHGGVSENSRFMASYLVALGNLAFSLIGVGLHVRSARPSPKLKMVHGMYAMIAVIIGATEVSLVSLQSQLLERFEVVPLSVAFLILILVVTEALFFHDQTLPVSSPPATSASELAANTLQTADEGDHDHAAATSSKGDHDQAAATSSEGGHDQAATISFEGHHDQAAATSSEGGHDHQAAAISSEGDHDQAAATSSEGDHADAATSSDKAN